MAGLWNGRARFRRGFGARRLTYDLRSCTPFEAAVLRKALEIPRGQVRPYNWIAREIGRPKAMRAVGSALANNPVPILIPCHRVVRGDGKIGNYALGGAWDALQGRAVDENLLLADVCGRPPCQGTERATLSDRARRARRRLSSLQALTSRRRLSLPLDAGSGRGAMLKRSRPATTPKQ